MKTMERFKDKNLLRPRDRSQYERITVAARVCRKNSACLNKQTNSTYKG